MWLNLSDPKSSLTFSLISDVIRFLGPSLPIFSIVYTMLTKFLCDIKDRKWTSSLFKMNIRENQKAKFFKSNILPLLRNF